MVAVAAVIAVAIAVGSGGNSASLGGWQSGDHVAVKGEPAGTCATAYSPTSYQLAGDQWVICGSNGSYRCYLQPMHPINFKAQPIQPTAFDSDCRSALAVLRKAHILH